MGKLPSGELKKLLRHIKEDRRMVVPPQLGMDSGVHRLQDDRCLVVSTDPCIGVPTEWFGWFLIHYVASDLPLFGAGMDFCTVNLLGGPETEPETFQEAARQTSEAAEELGAAVVTGHTGTYRGLSALLGVCTGYSLTGEDRVITPADVQPGDRLICVKPVGLETLINWTLTHRKAAGKLLEAKRVEELKGMVTMQSCVKEANLLGQVEGVHGMHDATEGGITVALNEMAEASQTGFQVEWEKLPIPEGVHRLKEAYQLSSEQLLSMSSTGTVLAAVHPEAEQQALEVLGRNQVEARVVGTFTSRSSRVLVKNGRKMPFPAEACDPYSTLLTREP